MKPIIPMHKSIFTVKAKKQKPSQLDLIISNAERDIVYGKLEGANCEKKDLKYWAGYVAHAKEFLKELNQLKK